MFRILKSDSLKFFIGYQKKYIKIVFGALLVLLVSVLLKLPSPLITKYLIDKIIPTKNFEALNNLCILLLGLILLYNVSQFILKIILAKYSARIRNAIEADFYKHMQKLPMKFFLNNSSGYIVSRINEIANTEQVMASTMVQVVRDVITLLVGAVLILHMNFRIGLVSLVVLPFFIYSIKAFHKKIKEINLALHEERANYLGKLERNVTALERIKVMVKHEVELDRVKKRIGKVLKLKVDSEIISGVASVTSSFIGMISPFFVLWYGVSEIMEGNLLLGEFFAINSFLAFVYGPAQSLTNIGYMISQAMAGLDRVYNIFQEPEEESGVKKIEKLEALEIKNLSFRYSDSGDYVLKNINLSIKAGEKVAIVGRSGSGKSTLIKILLKFFSDYEGEIIGSGVDIRSYDNDSYRSRISYLGQNQQLLEEDLEAFLTNSGDEEKFNSIKTLFSLDIDKLRDNLVQKKISGGEAQRLDALQVLAGEPKDFCIIDEGTSNIDSITENRIFDELLKVYQNRMLIFITHDLKSASGFDRIVVLDKGAVVQDGSHNELLKSSIGYRELWENNSSRRERG